MKPSFLTPRSMGRASPPMVLPQPNGPSTRLLLLADLVPRMVGGAAVDGGAAAGCVLHDMRRHVERAHVGDEVGRFEGLVAATVMRCAPGE